MKITTAKHSESTWSKDLVIICAFKSTTKISKSSKSKATTNPFATCETISEIDKKLSGHFINHVLAEGFEAKAGQRFLTSTLGQLKTQTIALLGLGDAVEQKIDTFRKAGGEAFYMAQSKRANKVGVIIPKEASIPHFDVVQAMTEGARLASYKFDRYLTKNKEEKFVKELEIILEEVDDTNKSALLRAESITEGVCLARDLINEGPMILNPQGFAQNAQKTAKDCGLAIEVLDEKKLQQEKMGLMLAVAVGSHDVAPPHLVRLHYKPKTKAKVKIGLVGKGVTFDSGGLDIKPADGMLDMKVDMSGAACVLGVMHAIGKLLPKAEVVGYMACVENSVGPYSYHPGDILISRKGTSVEVANTDAEGRLVLADAINYCCERDKPDILIDVATLTGACMIALGVKTAGLFANDDDLCSTISRCGEAVGESFWRLPLSQDLKEVISSPIADIKNCGDRFGGSITAALFLEEFVDKGIKWAHIDIAGPATNKNKHPYLTKGGVGFGVRTLVDFIFEQG